MPPFVVTPARPRLVPRASSPVPPPPTESGGLGTGAIIGISVGGAAGVAVLLVAIWYFARPSAKTDRMELMVPVTTSAGYGSVVAGVAGAGARNGAAMQQISYSGPPSASPTQPEYYGGMHQQSTIQSFHSLPFAGTAAAAMIAGHSAAAMTGVPESPEARRYVVVRAYVPQLNDELVLNVGDGVIVDQVSFFSFSWVGEPTDFDPLPIRSPSDSRSMPTTKKVFDDGWATGRNEVSKVEGLFPMACVVAG